MNISNRINELLKLTSELSSETLSSNNKIAIKALLIALEYTIYAIKATIDELQS